MTSVSSMAEVLDEGIFFPTSRLEVSKFKILGDQWYLFGPYGQAPRLVDASCVSDTTVRFEVLEVGKDNTVSFLKGEKACQNLDGILGIPILAVDLKESIIGSQYTNRINRTDSTEPFPDFYQKDHLLIKKLVYKYFSGGSRFSYPTYSLHQGKKTNKVIVLVHGFGESSRFFASSARRLFQKGYNVIVVSLPGFEDSPIFDTRKFSPELWIQFSKDVVNVAKNYGEKVIVAGHSLGGNLAIRLAEKKLVDGLILMEPLIKTSKYIDAIFFLSKFQINQVGPTADRVVTSFYRTILGPGLPWTANDAIKIQKATAQAIGDITGPGGSAMRIDVPIQVYNYLEDKVVSSSAILDWMKEFAPHSKMIWHRDKSGHVYLPFKNDESVYQFIEEI